MTSKDRIALCFGSAILLLGATVLLSSLDRPSHSGHLWAGAILAFTGAGVGIGSKWKLIFGPKGGEVGYEPLLEPPPAVEPKPLPEDRRKKLEERRHDENIPGHGAPAFEITSNDLRDPATPGAFPFVPAYWLDQQFRIVDWNLAFNALFDRTMEGRRGENVLEWVYFLENHEEVVKRGMGVFKDRSSYPLIDVETLKYESQRFGPITAVKRAYRLPNDDGSYRGWLVVLDPQFATVELEVSFIEAVLRTLGMHLMWTEYSLSYDHVLTNTDVYWGYVDVILGNVGALQLISPGARVLDLGAGTGNAAHRIASQEQERLVCAIDNNRAMLSILRAKNKYYLTKELDARSGVVPINQDVHSLFGLPEEMFDYAIMINVLYTLSDPVTCLKEVRKKLRVGGEIRIGSPKRDTNLDLLFEALKSDLRQKGRFSDLQQHWNRVERINRQRLAPMLYRWDVEDVQQMLRKAGFSNIGWSTEKAYAGQSMIVTARK